VEMSSAKVDRQVRGDKLAAASGELFEVGALETGPLDESFVRRVNTLVARRQIGMEKNIPVKLSDAITAEGNLSKHAELVVFGNWLINGRLGAKPRPGKQADPKKILKCVAAIMAEIEWAALKREHVWKEQGRKSRKQEITKHALADQWEILFDEKFAPLNFDAPLRSARHMLSDYLQHLKSGAATHAGKKIKKSPGIKSALDAITGLLSKSEKEKPEILTEPDVPTPARPIPFEIALDYQSDLHAEEHRRLPPGTKLESRLRYVPVATTATSSSGKARADREGKITLVPDADIRNNYQVKALIDRIVVLIETRVAIHPFNLRAMILKETGINTVVDDLIDPKISGDLWGAPFMCFDESILTGSLFAIMIQEPTPEVLAAILKTIKDGPGLIEPALLHLIEVSVDFYPKKPCKPEEAVLRRERLVGLLQRHHWTRPSRILEPDSARPRYSDARQIHDDEDKLPKRVPKTRYLFAHVSTPGKKTKHKSDSMIAEEGIRNRVLTTKPGYAILLNSTVSKGDKFKSHLISIQNKITDKRDPIREIYVSLPDDERRTRIEVTISGTETLKFYGLKTIDDLGSISFRKLAGDFLRCKLPTIEAAQHLFEDAQMQMRTRGVYAINLRLRALAQERREALKRAGGGTPRQTKDEELGLKDWKEMNAVTGHALDELTRRWSRFTTR
ncbi:MAG: hypothetical protein LC676_19440, partial [Loktanella sp.]|nr:hypothetical protein [Loktanella sp.]